MFRTLRNRLIASHMLPLIVILPILGIILTYILETRYLLPQIAQDLTSTAQLLAKATASQPEVWLSPNYAQSILEDTVPLASAQVMLLTPDSRLIASSLKIGPDRVGARLDFPNMGDVLDGKTVRIVHYSPRQNEEAVDIFAPAVTSSGQIVGIVRLTYRAAIFYEEFGQFRALIAAALLVALLFGAALGYVLAMNISQPIQQVTRLIYRVAQGELREPQLEYGPEEIRLLLRATNFLVERLNNLEHSRRQLLANLVHELGRPLGALRSAIHAITNGAGRDPQLLDDLARGMDAETIHLQRLLEDLAHLHDQSLGLMELNLIRLPLSDWLPGILPPWKQAAEEKRQHWVEKIPIDLPHIQADPNRLAQVVGNLLSNAIKYTPVGGTITIAAGTDEDTLWIRVSDSGAGIAVEEQAKIFNPYYRAQKNRRLPQGMGLGLSIARDLVSAHDGRLELDSTPGLGSHFTVRLPRQPNRA